MHRLEWEALAAFFALGVARATAERAAMVARLFFFVLLLSVFWAIWSATPLGEISAGLTASQIIWYFMINECIALAPGSPVRQVEADVQSGDIASALVRPLPYGLAAIAEWFGTALCRLLVLAAVGTAYTAFLTGEVGISAAALPALIIAIVLASAIMLLCYLQLGYVAAWAGSNAPAYWIWQKFLFLAGGLILPLLMYPSPLREIAELTPFSAMLFAPASLVFDSSGGRVLEVLGLQVFWLAVIAALTVIVDRAATRRFMTDGV